ncbi:MAG: TRAP transporter small permease subunit [Ahrensia sp.]|nr:TRAP transporter small permease subunit [Ahrensia sp.]
MTFLDHLIGWIAAAALAITFVLLSFSVFARYAAPSLQPQWVFEVTVFLLIWAILLGVARIEKRAGHIRVDFLLSMLGPRLATVAEVIALLAGIAVAVLFIWSGWIVVKDAIVWDERTESSLRLPFWILYAALSTSFAVHLLFILHRLHLVITGNKQHLPHGFSD